MKNSAHIVKSEKLQVIEKQVLKLNVYTWTTLKMVWSETHTIMLNSYDKALKQWQVD